MPDGSTNDTGCGDATRCCPTCLGEGEACGAGVPGACCPGGVCAEGRCCARATCGGLGLECGTADDGCGGTLACGVCPDGPTPVCDGGACASCPAACPDCFRCVGLIDGDARCGDTLFLSCPARQCSSPADCAGQAFSLCLLTDTIPSLGTTMTASEVACPESQVPAGVGVCVDVSPC